MEMYLILGFISLVLGIILLIIFIALFIKWDFIDIIETLSGSKRKRTIKDMDNKDGEFNINRDITSGVTSSLDYKGGDTTNQFIHDEISKVNKEIKDSAEDKRTQVEKEFDALDKEVSSTSTGVHTSIVPLVEEEDDKTEILSQGGTQPQNVLHVEEDEDITELLEPTTLTTSKSDKTELLIEEEEDVTSDLNEEKEESSIKIVNID